MSQSLSLARFEGKTAVVTGASAGIGKTIVTELVKHGIVVAGLARRVQRIVDHAEELASEKGKLYPFNCDISKQEEVLETFKQITTQLGPIHILVNNAGLLLVTNIIDGNIENWKMALETNVLGLAITTREAIASMKSNDIKGHIININSVLGHQVLDFPGLNIYPATKHAVTALTETLRLEINRENLPIKITSVSPGFVQTEFMEASSLDADTFGESFGESSRPALKSEDVATAVVYVLSTPEHVNVRELTLSTVGYIV